MEPSQIFWRAINTEIWMRVFFDHDGRSRAGDAPGEHFTRVGDEWLAVRNERAAAALAQFTPHEQRHLFAQSTVDGRAYAARADPHPSVRRAATRSPTVSSTRSATSSSCPATWSR